MTIYVGGIRERFIKDSVYEYLKAKLGALGWFNSGRQHAPIAFHDEAVDIRQLVALNTLTLSSENNVGDDIEMGSNLTEFTWTMFVDFYAESEAVGLHLIGDVAAILRGQMSSIGAQRSFVPVFDYFQATPADPIFYVGVEKVRTDKAHDFPHVHLRHWHACQFDIIDAYGDDSEGGSRRLWADIEGTLWSSHEGETWDELSTGGG
jgi:hypothetical protein